MLCFARPWIVYFQQVSLRWIASSHLFRTRRHLLRKAQYFSVVVTVQHLNDQISIKKVIDHLLCSDALLLEPVHDHSTEPSASRLHICAKWISFLVLVTNEIAELPCAFQIFVPHWPKLALVEHESTILPPELKDCAVLRKVSFPNFQDAGVWIDLLILLDQAAEIEPTSHRIAPSCATTGAIAGLKAFPAGMRAKQDSCIGLDSNSHKAIG